jgi:hypothetical protein
MKPYYYNECLSEGNYWACPLFEVSFQVDNSMVTVEYDIVTLDMILGIIGGLSGLIWQFNGLLIGDYEEFKKNMSLLKSFYTIDKNTTDINYV